MMDGGRLLANVMSRLGADWGRTLLSDHPDVGEVA